ncbi:50S ribosomal protein L21e [Candidatus Woesearchaeota archaeon]|nr:50S ribosomal protein L21e [Candidatus Woesearchaeota archaeon]
MAHYFLIHMTNRRGSYRRKTRKLMSKHFRKKGKISLTKYFAEFNGGEEVVLKAEPAVQKGIYHLRFHGKKGVIKAKQGGCYKVEILDGCKPKNLIVHPIHLARLK